MFSVTEYYNFTGNVHIYFIHIFQPKKKEFDIVGICVGSVSAPSTPIRVIDIHLKTLAVIIKMRTIFIAELNLCVEKNVRYH